MPEREPPAIDAGLSDIEERINALKVNSDRILIRLVTTIARACTMYGTRSMSHMGISISQAVVLGETFRHNGCRQEDIRAFVALDKGNVTRALQRLEESGLVERKQDPADRRVVRVYVTRKALSIEAEMFALANHWDERLTEGFTDKERETLIDLLLRMETNAKAVAKSDGARAGYPSS